MHNDNINSEERQKVNAKHRIYAYAFVLAFVFILELTTGYLLEGGRLATLSADDNLNWAQKNYLSGYSDSFVQPKAQNTFRIAYVSNSHALTGGKVSRHLQDLLHRASPGRFEVIDMSEAGIFAPEIYQRCITAKSYDIDVLLLSPGYISFSDRMNMRMQGAGVKQFFSENIFADLDGGFWLRNYDVGLYLDELASSSIFLVKNRNAFRRYWSVDLAGTLKNIADNRRPVYFLEFEESTTWQFPDGYDNNLFQWKLYALGRENHMKDLNKAVLFYINANIPVIMSNLPIHFEKSLYEPDLEDYKKYQGELYALGKDASGYNDLQDYFPFEFSTYDALHPIWNGARLHAFDLLLRLLQSGKFGSDIDANTLLDQYKRSTNLNQYEAKLETLTLNDLSFSGFRRFDFTQLDNAIDLLARVINRNPLKLS